MAGKAVEKMIAEAVHEAVRNLREQEAQLEFSAFAEEREEEVAELARQADSEGGARKTRTMVDCYRDTMAWLSSCRHSKQCAASLGERRNWEMEALEARYQLRKDFQDFAELHGEAVAEYNLQKAFDSLKGTNCEGAVTKFDLRFATGNDPW